MAKFLNYHGVETLWGKIKTWVNNAISTKADLASPTFTGTPAAPTAAAGTNTTQIATTAFVESEISSHAITVDSALSSSSTNPVQNKVINSALNDKAPKASPTFTGTPKAPTASTSTNSTQIATTAFVQSLISSKISSAYKAAGSLAPSGIVSTLLVAANEGNVYNINADFTTTSDFVEGAGVTYKAGTNIVVMNNGTSASPSYKFDVLGGMTDMSAYLTIIGGKEQSFLKELTGLVVPYQPGSMVLQATGYVGDYWWNGQVLKICTATGEGGISGGSNATYANVTTAPDCLFLIGGDICYYVPNGSNGTMVNILEGATTTRGGVIIKLHDISSQPSAPQNGDLWWDETNEMLKEYSNGSWTAVRNDDEHIFVDDSSYALINAAGTEIAVPDFLVWSDAEFANVWSYLVDGEALDGVNTKITQDRSHMSHIESGIAVFRPLSQRIYTSGSVISGSDLNKLNQAHAHGDYAYEVVSNVGTLYKLTASGTDYVWTAVTVANAYFTPSSGVLLEIDGDLYCSFDETAGLIRYLDYYIDYVTDTDLNTICV